MLRVEFMKRSKERSVDSFTDGGLTAELKLDKTQKCVLRRGPVLS